MVQTYQSPVRIYKYPFEVVMAAYQRRFPTCPQIPIFVGSEIMSEFHSTDGAEEVIERKCQLNVEAPYLVKKVAGVDYVYFMQKNSLDRRKRTLLIEATNISFSSRIVVKEDCNYYVHPDNGQWTCFEQSASLVVKSFFGFETSVEKLAVKQYAANLAKGKEILEHFIAEVVKEGTSHLVPFTELEPGIGHSRSPGDSAIDVSKQDNDSVSAMPSSTARRHSRSMEKRRDSHTYSHAESNTVPMTEIGVNQPSSSSAMRNVHQSSFDDPEEKLEAEYIRRFIGLLSELEQSRLCELKYGLLAAHKGKLPNDAHLLRFLRARDFDVAKARDMIINSLLWRKQHNVDKILQEFEPPAVLTQFFPGCWHHHDKQGRPVFVLRLGQLDIKGLLRTVGLEPIVKFTLSICEQGLLKAAEATKLLGVPISTWTLLVDLEGLSMRHLWRPGVQSLLRIIEIVQAHYPETMGLVLITRAPRVFPVLWTLISPFIDENTREKFMINSGEPVHTELGKYLDEHYIPDFLGGTCFCLAAEGGHVPKSLYQQMPEHIVPGDDVLTSIYTSAHVYKGAPHEVLVTVATKGCVLTWDFDVIRGECEFLVLHTARMLSGNKESSTSPHSPILSPVEMVTAAISGPGSAVVAEPSLRLGVDLVIKEKPVVCKEGDSMQGSHFCSAPGTYIMQWRNLEPGTTTQHAAFDFSLPGQKCKLFYYHELLDSADFRGSVASLESCRSSFNSLAPLGSSTPDTPSSIKKQNHPVVQFLS